MIDLHVHSTASDGSLSVPEILDLAQKNGIKALSITDHDTIDGIKELVLQSIKTDIDYITGVEISCEPPKGFETLGSIHMLGYGFSIYDSGLNHILGKAKTARTSRNPKIIEKLNRIGFDITMEQVESRFGAHQTGRPHIAEFMKEKGYVSSFSEAFDKYLGKNKPGYVDKYKVSCQKAIQTIRDAGGIAVLAHPGLLNFSRTGQDEELLDTLIGWGLEGLEVFYSDHDEKRTRYYHDMATRKKILETGGSDFHGSFNKGISLGTGKGKLYVDYSLYKKIVNRLDRNSKEMDLHILEKNIGYSFKDRSLLENALCHRSYLNENPDSCLTDNERLEFLGDAVVGLCIGQVLMEASPLKKEGELSKLRSGLVSEPGLAVIARAIDLGRFIKLGRGESLSRGYEKNSILSDTFEAVVAAIYLDSDFNTVYDLLNGLFKSSLEQLLSKEKVVDYKSMLQEHAQESGTIIPQYRVQNETGPDHDKTFEVWVELFDTRAKGLGRTKKAAEQDAAQNALMLLGKKQL